VFVRIRGLEGGAGDGEPAPVRSRVTLTRCPVVVSDWSLFSGLICPPIGPAYIAASLRQRGYPVSLVDPTGESPFEVHGIPGRKAVYYGWRLEKIVEAFPSDTRYIGLSCMFSHEWPVSKTLARLLRERFPNALIVAGGEHITAAPESSLGDCEAIDYAVLGEGEETMADLLETLDASGGPDVPGVAYRRGGEVVRTAPRSRMRNIDSIPRPAWDLVPIENYLMHNLSYGVGSGRTMPILATRGCPYECTFCSNPTMWTTRWYARTPRDVADEIQSYVERYQATNFDFYDLTAILRKDWIKEFSQELMDRKLNITWQLPAGTRSEAVDGEVAGMLARSGHRNLVYAPESGSPRVLKAIKKKVRLPRMAESIRGAVDNGISVKLNMIMGFPMETRRDLLHSYAFMVKAAWLGVDDVTISTFIPYPGSELFDDLRRQGRIPELSDDFYFHLVAMGDARDTPSYCASLGARELGLWRIGGMLCFYAFSYLTRPSRIFRTIRNLRNGDHQTRIEKALDALIGRLRDRRGQKAPLSVPVASAAARLPVQRATAATPVKSAAGAGR
jgi:anaerobic magnesium-protoporphyrin IX monomethyl ester cyclase